MEIERLYEELGRTASEDTKLRAEEQVIQQRYNDEMVAAEERYQQAADSIKFRRSRMWERTKILQEAIRLTRDEGMDPVLAKLKAKESLEERDEKSDEGLDVKSPYPFAPRPMYLPKSTLCDANTTVSYRGTPLGGTKTF